MPNQDLLDPYSPTFQVDVLAPLCRRALEGEDVDNDLCLALRPWVESQARRIASSLPALCVDEVGHLIWMAVLGSLENLDFADPQSWPAHLRKRVRVVRAEAVRAEIGRTGKRRMMSVPIEWFLYLPVDRLFSPIDPLVESDEEERIEAMLDQLPPDLASATRHAVETGTPLSQSDARRVAQLLSLGDPTRFMSPELSVA
ncbi:MAG: hypothetical protein M0Z95_20060 [Actinomycetota bacterium]|nr:hypothetical protein [Actinomycetota bacterium]